MNRKALDELASDVWRCNECKRKDGDSITPCILVGNCGTKVVVVSEGPPKKSLKNDLGSFWKSNDSRFDEEKGTGNKICMDLGVEISEFPMHMLWIQRRNCWLMDDKKRKEAIDTCSRIFVERAIDAAEPEIILALGGIASSYFGDFGKMGDIKNPVETVDGAELWVLYHPSYTRRFKFSDPSIPALRMRMRKILPASVFID